MTIGNIGKIYILTFHTNRAIDEMTMVSGGYELSLNITHILQKA